VDGLAALLLRCNVLATISRRHGWIESWRLSVDGLEQQLRFLDAVGLGGVGAVGSADVAERIRAWTGTEVATAIPQEIWTNVRKIMDGEPQRLSPAAHRLLGSLGTRPLPSRERLARVATVLDDASLDILATNDIFWDAVAEIAPLGEQETYDATVLGTHNFVANGIAVHNSLEQDADVVLLIHREDFYEPESPRAGEADLLVVKHRNGPTGTVTVAFQGHYSRFVDMAR